MKSYIFRFRNQWKIGSGAHDFQEWQVIYTPVYIIETNNDGALIDAIFDCLTKSKQIVNLGDFPANQKDYKNYVEKMMKAFQEKSFDQLQKNSQEFFIEYNEADRKTTVTPLIWQKKQGGSVPVTEKIKVFENLDLNKRNLFQALKYIKEFSFEDL